MSQIPLARNSDPLTSHVAAANVPAFQASHEAKIYDVLTRSIGITGMTYREIAHHAKLEPIAVARRLIGMERRKLIERDRDMATGKYLQRDNMALWFKRDAVAA
jgi:hypothetical protein